MKTLILICSKIVLLLLIATSSLLAQSIKHVKVEGSGLHDGSNWENALSNEEFQLALKKATKGSMFLLSAGIYEVLQTDSDKSTFLIPTGVKIIGGYPANPITDERNWELNKTILSGDTGIKKDTSDNVLNTVTFASPANESLLDGVTVEGATAANVSGCSNGSCETSLPIKNSVISPVVGSSPKQTATSANIETLSQAFNMTKCGLNYTTFSQRLGQRFSPLGVPQPAAFTISGIPETAKIERVFIWADASGNGSFQKVTLFTPVGNIFTYPMTLVGAAADKCWNSRGYLGSYTYRADVTSSVKGNGTYLLSGLSTGSGNDIDGATIFVIYSDPTAAYQGTLTIDDGALVASPGYRNYTQSFAKSCGTTTNARAFMGIGDLQYNQAEIYLNGTYASYSWNWWNYLDVSTTIGASQTGSNFSVSTYSDCYNIAFVGTYYQSTSCNSCNIVLEQYHTIPTNPKFSTKKLITDSKKGLKVCSDGTSVTSFKVSGLGNSIGLRILEDPNATNPAKYGKFLSSQIVTNGVEFKYQHPTSIISTGKFVTFNIELYNTTNSIKITTFSLDVYHAPVITVHGLWSEGDSFNDLQKYLTNSNNTQYNIDLVQKADYSSNNDGFFATNLMVIPNKIDEVIQTLRDKGYGAGKFDLVGHSMGGILSRLYLQNGIYRDDIYRIITINTPHSGSQIANLLNDPNYANRRETICDLISSYGGAGNPNPNCNNGAINDLRVNSAAIQSLNGPNRNARTVPSYSIVTNKIFQPTTIPVMNRTVRPALQVAYETAINTSHSGVFNAENSDLIVAESSQRGGMAGCTVTFTNQIHMGAQDNALVMERVRTLLISSPTSGNFCTSGFNPPTLTYNNPPPTNPAPLTSIASTVAINLPVNGRSVTDNQTLDFNISGSNVVEMFILIGLNKNETVVYRTQNSTFSFTETINSTFDTGIHTIQVIGKKSDGSMVTTKRTFIVTRCQPSLGPLSGILDQPFYQVSNAISTDGVVSSGQNVSFTAQKKVELLPGFTTETNAVFKVNMANCTN